MSTAAPPAPFPEVLQSMPADGSPPAQLMILLHGWGASAQDMAPLAQVLGRQFPRAAFIVAQGFEPVDGTGPAQLAGRQWFSLAGITEDNRPARVAAVLPRLADAVRAAQAATGVGPEATALIGFSQGAILSLELVQQHDGIAGRVLAFSGRYASLPEVAPQQTTLHLFHGADDPVIAVAHAKAAMERLNALQADATIDIASATGHTIPPALLDCALHRLTSHIPRRTWNAALGAAAEAQRQAQAGDDGAVH